MSVDYIIDPSLSPSGNRYQSFAALATGLGTNKNRTTVNLGRPTEIRIDTTLTENYDFASWTTDATNSILIYGLTQATQWIPASSYSNCIVNSSKHVKVQYLTFNGNAVSNGSAGIFGSNGWFHGCIIHGFGANSGENVYAIMVNGGGKISNCLSYDNYGVGIVFDRYGSNFVYNNTSIHNKKGYNQVSSGDTNTTFWNNIAFGNSTSNWGNVHATQASSRNNFGESGDTITDTVGSTSRATLTTSDFVDSSAHTPSGYHITSTSRARHNHASYPTGNNVKTELAYDIDGEAMPTSYATDADRLDSGCDYYVLIVLGTQYYRDSSLSPVTGGSSIKRTSDNTSFTFADLVAEDTLQIKSGAVVEFKDNGTTTYNFLAGIQLDIQNGEVKFTNALTTKGQTFHGIKGGFLKPGAQGKFTSRALLVELADLSGGAYSSVRDLDNGEWDTMWGTGTKDSLGNYGEPSVLFVGATSGAAIPYYNKGSGTTIGDLANDSSHGRVFKFDPANGNITWPDLVPSTSVKVYCYNIMVHCQNGGGTPVQSFGIDTTAKGQVDIQNTYFTGNPSFVDASKCILSGFGVLQPFVVDHCSNVVLDVYQSVSQANQQLGTMTIKNLKNVSALGKIGCIGTGTAILLQNLRKCVFDTIWAEGFGSQSSGAYRILVDGTDDCDFGNVTAIDGGLSFETKISNNPIIRVFNHSNDQSGSNGNNSQHAIYGASTGTRGLRVEQINLLTSGYPTALDLVNLSNAGGCRVLGINYGATIRNLLGIEDCFDILVSKGSIGRCSAQLFKALGKNSEIRIQSIKNTSSPSSPPAFVEFSTGTEDVSLRNVPYETSDRYSGWALPITNMNFEELNLGNGSTGKLVLNFSQNTKSELLLTNGATSDNAASVILPAVNDRVEVEWPYDLLVGSASPYFTTTAIVTTGTNTGNLTFEYAININGAGYGSWATLTASALNALSISTKFRIKFRVTCATASATNAIKQIVLSTNIDSTVEYPSASYTLTLTGLQDDTEIRMYDSGGTELAGIEDVGAGGTFTYTYDYYSDTTVTIHIMHLGYIFQRFVDFPLTAANKSQLVQQSLDRTYANP
jgi:hypothetical protein